MTSLATLRVAPNLLQLLQLHYNRATLYPASMDETSADNASAIAIASAKVFKL
jgi:hypothetical protein